MAILFLAAYAWPILQPDLEASARTACSVVLWVVWLTFGVDYTVRLVTSSNKVHWFTRHLLDFVVLIVPIARPLRLLRLVTLVRVLNRSAALNLRGRVGIYVGFGSALLAFVAALAALDAERSSPDANIKSFGDAMWWACTTMTTVGYGDRFPVTSTGRLVGVGLMVAGIGLLGTVTATLASLLVETVSAEAVEAIEESQAENEADLHHEMRGLRQQVAVLLERLERADAPESSP